MTAWPLLPYYAVITFGVKGLLELLHAVDAVAMVTAARRTNSLFIVICYLKSCSAKIMR